MHAWITILGLVAVGLVAVSVGGWAEPLPYIYLATLAAVVTAAFPFLTPYLRNAVDALRQPRRLGRWEVVPARCLPEIVAAMAFLAVAAAMFPAQALGDRPIDHDHTVHFFRAWQLRDFLSHGRFFGWSHRWFAGYPVNYLYPIGADFWVLTIWLLGLGKLTLDKAYALGVVAFWALQGYGTYRAGRALIGRATGIVAGLFVMLDTGAFRFGGWVFAGQWGVWPNSLAIALGMLAVAELPGLMHGKDRGPLARFAVLMGVSLMTHPLQLVHTLALLGIAALALVTSTREGSRTLGMLRLGGAGLLTVVLSLPWLLPFLSTRDQSDNYGEPWRNAYDMGAQLYANKLLEGSWALVSVLMLVGVAALLRHRRASPSFVALMTLLCAAGASSWFIAAFHLPSLTGSFSFLQYQRFAMILKPYAFIAAAYAVVSVLSTVSWRHAKSPLRTFVVALFAAPIVFGWLDALRMDQLSRNFQEASQRPYAQARLAAAQWLTQEWDKRDVPFYRVETRLSRHDHSFVDFGTLVPMPIYKSGFTPAETFRLKMESTSREVLEALNVRYVLAPRPPGADFDEVKDFGQGLKAYEFKRWKPDPFVVEGSGSVTLKSWDDERIVLEAGPDASGALRLNVSAFPRWHAERDGVALDIAKVALSAESRTGFMKVPLAPGTYVFEFRRAWPEYVGAIVGVGGWLLVLAVWGSTRRSARLGVVETPILHAASVVEDFDRPGNRLVTVLGSLGVVAVAAGLVGLAIWTPAVHVAQGVTQVRFDTRQALHRAEVRRGQRACQDVLGRHICTREEYGHVYNTVAEFGGQLRECVWAHPYAKSTLSLAWQDVPQGKLLGWFGVADTGEGNASVTFKVAQSDTTVFEGATKRDGTAVPFEADVAHGPLTITVDTTNQGKRHFCFVAQVVNPEADLMLK